MLHFWVSNPCTGGSPCLRHCSTTQFFFAQVEELETSSLSIRRKQPYAEGATQSTSEEQPAARSLLALAVSCKLHEGKTASGVLIPADVRSALSCLGLEASWQLAQSGLLQECLLLGWLGARTASTLPPAIAADPADNPSRSKLQCWHMAVSSWTPCVECGARHTF